jgi:hypothetical protein
LNLEKKAIWRDALIWAVIAAVGIEIGCNVISRRTLWQRMDTVEEKIKQAEHEKELEELRTQKELDELRVKADTNKQELKEVEKEVKRK